MKICNQILIYGLSAMLMAGCSKNILEENSPSIILADNLYKNKVGLLMAKEKRQAKSDPRSSPAG